MRRSEYDGVSGYDLHTVPSLVWGSEGSPWSNSGGAWGVPGLNSALNPYRSARCLVLLTGVLLVSLVFLDWMYPSGTRATLVGAEDVNRAVPKMVRAALLFVMFLYVLLTAWDPGAYGFAPGRMLAVFSMYMAVSVFLSPGDWGPRLSDAIKSLLWVVAAVGCYRLTLGGYVTAGKLRCLAGTVVMIASFYTIAYCLFGDYRRGTNANVAALIWCIPLLLLTAPPPWASALAGLASVAAIVTCKRGALLALLIGGCVYAVGLRFLSPHAGSRVKHIVALIVLTAALCATVAWQWEKIENKMADFDDPETMGSGRGWFYRVIIVEWYRSDVFDFFLGKGLFTVPDTVGRYGPAVFAHSDWLEILHDMGLVGVFLFACVNGCFISLLARAMRWRLSILPPLAMAYSIFVLRSLISGCVIGSVENIYFGVLLGYGAARITIETTAPWWPNDGESPAIGDARFDVKGTIGESLSGDA